MVVSSMLSRAKSLFFRAQGIGSREQGFVLAGDCSCYNHHSEPELDCDITNNKRAESVEQRAEGIVLAQKSFCRNRHCETASYTSLRADVIGVASGNPANFREQCSGCRAEGHFMNLIPCDKRHCEQLKTAWQSKNILPFLRGDVSQMLTERFSSSSDFFNYNHQSILSNIICFPIFKYYPPAFAGFSFAKIFKFNISEVK